MADEPDNAQDGFLPEPNAAETHRVVMRGSANDKSWRRRWLLPWFFSIGLHLFLLPFVLAITVTFADDFFTPATDDSCTHRQELGNDPLNALESYRDYPVEQIEELSVAAGSNIPKEENQVALPSEAPSLDHQGTARQPAMVGQIIIIGNN